MFRRIKNRKQLCPKKTTIPKKTKIPEKKTFCLFDEIEGTIDAWKYENSNKVNELKVGFKNNTQLVDGLEFILKHYEGEVWIQITQSNSTDDGFSRFNYFFRKILTTNTRELIQHLIYIFKPFVYLDSDIIKSATFMYKNNLAIYTYNTKNVPVSYIQHLSKADYPIYNLYLSFRVKLEKKLASGAVVDFPEKIYYFKPESMKQLLEDIQYSNKC